MPDDVVERIIQAALAGMEELPDQFTNRQLLSAVFTIALRTSQMAVQREPHLREAVRQGCEVLMLHLVDLGGTRN